MLFFIFLLAANDYFVNSRFLHFGKVCPCFQAGLLCEITFLKLLYVCIYIYIDGLKVDGVARARCKNYNEMVTNARGMKSHFNACSKKTGDCSTTGSSAAKQHRLIQSTLRVSSTGHTKQQEFDASITKFRRNLSSSPQIMIIVLLATILIQRMRQMLSITSKISMSK